jgi:hypothetical protein
LSSVILRQPPTGIECDGVTDMVSVEDESVVLGEADIVMPASKRNYPILRSEW